MWGVSETLDTLDKLEQIKLIEAKMSWRFKASKYKNAAPIEAKKDLHIKELSIGSYSTGYVF